MEKTNLITKQDFINAFKCSKYYFLNKYTPKDEKPLLENNNLDLLEEGLDTSFFEDLYYEDVFDEFKKMKKHEYRGNYIDLKRRSMTCAQIKKNYDNLVISNLTIINNEFVVNIPFYEGYTTKKICKVKPSSYGQDVLKQKIKIDDILELLFIYHVLENDDFFKVNNLELIFINSAYRVLPENKDNGENKFYSVMCIKKKWAWKIANEIAKKLSIELSAEFIDFSNKYRPLDKEEYEDKVYFINLVKDLEFVFTKIISVIKAQTNCPKSIISQYCKKIFSNGSPNCEYFGECIKEISGVALKDSIFFMHGKKISWSLKHYKNTPTIKSWGDHKIKADLGEISPRSIQNKYDKINYLQYLTLSENPYIEKDNIKKLIDKWGGHLYFFDFESITFPIPRFEYTKPYEHVPCQYSLHIVKEGQLHTSAIIHKEFLADPTKDPRFQICKQMYNDLKSIMHDGGKLVAWHKPYEIKCIKSLNNFLSLADNQSKVPKEVINFFHWLVYEEPFVDLKDFFAEGYYYDREFKKSFSIKKVLPAFVPSLSYDDLSVANGMQAIAAYKKMVDQQFFDLEIKSDLLKYCELDTWAMVEIYKKLCEIIK